MLFRSMFYAARTFAMKMGQSVAMLLFTGVSTIGMASGVMKSTGGLSNNSNGMPKHIRPIMDSAMVAMAMMQGLTSAIVNPNDLRLMETIKSCDIIKNNYLYADSYLEI